MCFASKPNLQPSPLPEPTPTAPVVNGADASANKTIKSNATGVNALKIPLNVPAASTGLSIPQ